MVIYGIRLSGFVFLDQSARPLSHFRCCNGIDFVSADLFQFSNNTELVGHLFKRLKIFPVSSKTSVWIG